MRVRVFGSFGAIDDDGQELSVGGPKQRTVLALLSVEPGRHVTTDSLMMAVWGDKAPGGSRRSLSTYVSNLRRELGDVIDSGPGSYVLRLERSQIDSCAFTDAVDAAGSAEGADGAARYREALSLWTGVPFSGLDGFGAFREEAHRLDTLRLVAERAVIEADIGTGEAASVVPHIDALTKEFPFDEGLRGLHMRALYRSGRQADALALFSSFRSRLANELGLDPSRELQDLELRILQHDESLDPQRGDLPEIGRVSGLPNRYSSFVGREIEVAEASERLAEHRLVSLIGPGGIGKSSIALETARTLQTGDVAVVHVPIESVAAGDVAGSTARSIGLEPAASIDPVDVIASYVATRPHVLVLDGCEVHISEVAQLADRLLSLTDCTLLVTSREPLGLNGESTIRIDALGIDAATEVFKDRAELPADLDDETQETVRLVCAALDGMPLAIELAGARAKTVPLDRLAVRMNDQIPLLTRTRSFDEKHGSLLAALDWSYNLLDQTEQSALLAVSVFLTPFTRDDAAAMVDTPSIEDDVARLVEMSLLQPPTPSGVYRFLEPVRQYARHRLAASDLSEDAQQRHAEWMATVARRASKDEFTPRIREVRSQVFEKRDEMLAAIKWALESEEPDLVLAIVAAIGRLLTGLGAYGPFVAPALTAIRHPAATRDHDYAVASAKTAGMLAVRGNVSEALALLDRTLVLAETLNDLIAQGQVKFRQALLRTRDGGLELMDEAFELLRAGGDPNWEWLRYNRAMILLSAGRFEEASQMSEEHRRWCQTHLEQRNFGPNGIMAVVSSYEGNWETALDLHEDAATLAEADSMYRHAWESWEGAGLAAVRLQSADRLANAAAQLERIAEVTGTPPSIPLDIEVALDRNNFHEVLTLARLWFTATRDGADDSDVFISSDHDLTIYGSRQSRPAIFAILRPVAAALLATDRRDEACRIISAVPDLMNQSSFEYWSEFRETELWDSLSDACRSHSESDTEPLTLLGVFELVKGLVDSDPTIA
ncbi:MAG: BTAD domain-containing putative transcriptional regulator [Actinomycetota bacterium]|nr:BTAD domain-containing putative transcriptional regulator [Actinomycetota bacterium]